MEFPQMFQVHFMVWIIWSTASQRCTLGFRPVKANENSTEEQQIHCDVHETSLRINFLCDMVDNIMLDVAIRKCLNCGHEEMHIVSNSKNTVAIKQRWIGINRPKLCQDISDPYTTSISLDCLHKTGWIHGFMPLAANCDRAICVLQQKSRFISPCYVFEVFNCPVWVILCPLQPQLFCSWLAEVKLNIIFY